MTNLNNKKELLKETSKILGKMLKRYGYDYATELKFYFTFIDSLAIGKSLENRRVHLECILRKIGEKKALKIRFNAPFIEKEEVF